MKIGILLTSSLLGLCLLAADKMEPLKAKLGLWEVTSTQQISGLPTAPSAASIPPEKLAQMPPAQRAQIEAMLKRTAGSPTVRTRQTCITQEKLDKAQFTDERGTCQRTIVTSTSKMVVMHQECTDDRGFKTSADAKYEVVDDNNMKGSIKGKATVAGRAVDLNIDLTGKWLGADCGTVGK